MSTQDLQTAESHSEDAWAGLLEQAIALYSAGKMQASAAAFDQLITAGVHVADASYGLGLIRLAGGDMDGAAAELTRALQHNPRHASALYVLGTIAERQSAWGTARMYYAHALAIDPEMTGPVERLAQLAGIPVSQAPQTPMGPAMEGLTPGTVRRRRPWGSAIAYVLATGVLWAILTIGNTVAANAMDSFSAGIVFHGIAGIIVLAWFIGGIRLVRTLIQGTPSG